MRRAVVRLLIVLGLLNWAAAGAMAATTSEAASHVSTEVRSAYAYDSPAATMTASGTARSGALRGPREVSRSRTRAESLSAATKAGTGAARAVPTGLKDVSPGLRGAFDGGSIRDLSIIGVRSALTENGFARQQRASSRSSPSSDARRRWT